MLDQGGKYISDTNADRFWPSGIWKETTNGWRVMVYAWNTNTFSPTVSVAVGSRSVNSGGGYFKSYNGKFTKFELVDSKGAVIKPMRWKSMEYQFPIRISDENFPKWPDGGLKYLFGFSSNGPPVDLNDVKLFSVFRVEAEGDYILTVSPVIYRHEANAGFLDRVDLPTVTIKMHLRPSS